MDYIGVTRHSEGSLTQVWNETAVLRIAGLKELLISVVAQSREGSLAR